MATLTYTVNALDGASGVFAKIALSADDLNKQIDQLGRKSATARIALAGDTKAKVSLDELNLRLTKLKDKVTDPEVTVKGLATSYAGITRLNLALDKLATKDVTAHVKVDVDRSMLNRLASRFLGGKSGGGSGLAGVLPTIFGLGGGGAGAAGLSGATALGGLPLEALIPGAAAAVVALTALTPTIAGTGVALAGMAGFAAAAVPVVTNLTSALSGLRTATNNYQAASANLNIAIHKSPADLAAYRATIHGLEPDLQNAAKLLTNQNVVWQNLSPSMRRSEVALFNNSSAYKALLPDQKLALTALLKEKTAWDQLSPAQQGIAKNMQALGGQFSKLETAIQPFVLTAFGTGLKIIKDLMPAFQPLLIAAGRALDTFLGKMDSWLNSPSGQKFVHWLATTGPNDIANLGKFFWDAAQFIGRALKFMYDRGQFVIQNFRDMAHFFTVILPGALQIFLLKNQLVWDKLVIGALGAVKGILDAFGHLPFGMGAPFRAASKTIGTEMDKWKSKAVVTAADIQATWDRLHGVTVPIKTVVVLPAGFGASQLQHKFPGLAGGSPGARPGWHWVGEKGPELVRMVGGETVIPNHAIGGYAGGTIGPHVAGEFPTAAAITAMGNTLQAAIGRLGVAIGQALGPIRIMAPFGSFGPGGGGPAASVARRMFPWPASMWPAFNYVEMREAGYNIHARNPSSGAYGVAQFINGPSEYYQWGGNPNTAAGQFAGMFNYIRSRYGNPLGAAAHERAFSWYDNSGWLPPGPSLAMNATGQPEAVIGGGPLARVEALLVKILAATQAAPPRTGAAVSAGVNGGARAAGRAAYYATRPR